MEYARVFTLLAITLLPNCRAEISDTPESWYSANVINDGSFSPKPLTEIFSTKPSFPSTNPLIILSTTTENQNFGRTSTFTPSNISTVPITSSTFITSTDREAVVPLQTTTSASITQPQISQTKPQLIQTEGQTLRSPLPSQLTQSRPITLQSQLPSLQPVQPIIIQSQPNPLQSQPGFVQQFVIPPQSLSNQSRTQSNPVTQPDPRTTGLPNPNYFVIYQQAPQSIQTGSQQMASTVSPGSIPTPPAITVMRPTQVPYISKTMAQRPQVSTVLPPLIPQPSAQYPVLRIRMIAPSGSITNVNVNPPNNPTTTIRTTTTRAATTKARKTRRKNNYDDCVNSCGETRQPICASPVGVIPVNPDTLRGFPSICHMACHNSFRRNAYEKVIDGKCGRLRTRIRTVDSDTKLKREELNKVQYTIVQPGPQTIVEFSPLTS